MVFGITAGYLSPGGLGRGNLLFALGLGNRDYDLGRATLAELKRWSCASRQIKCLEDPGKQFDTR